MVVTFERRLPLNQKWVLRQFEQALDVIDKEVVH